MTKYERLKNRSTEETTPRSREGVNIRADKNIKNRRSW